MLKKGFMSGTHSKIVNPGIAFALISALLFGLSTPFAKLLVGQVQPLVLAGLLYLGSGLGLWIIHSLGKLRASESSRPFTRQEMPYLIAAVVCGGVISPILLLFGLAQSLASTASLLLNIEGVLTATIAWLVFKENCDRRIVAGMLAITCGGVVLSVTGSGGFSFSWGCVLVVLSCLGWAIDNNLTRQIAHGDAVKIALVKGVCAGFVNLFLGLAFGGVIPNVMATLGALVVGFLGYGLSLVLFVFGLRHLGTARTGAYFSTAPFVGAVASIVLLHESVSANFAIAGALMMLGVWLHLTEHHEHWHEHEEMFHDHEHVHDDHHQHEHGPDDPHGEPHSHVHRHGAMAHSHLHFPDIHHRHSH